MSSGVAVRVVDVSGQFLSRWILRPLLPAALLLAAMPLPSLAADVSGLLEDSA